MGKAYANKKKEEDRPIGDFYPTPKSLVWVMEEKIKEEFPMTEPILEPASGQYGRASISDELIKIGYCVTSNDLYYGGTDYLLDNELKKYSYVITNPPFSLFDEFVNRSKEHCKKFMYIGKTNYFGTHSRNITGIWKNLKTVYIFDRYVDYRTPYREDGMFHVGALCTAWFLFDMRYDGKPAIEIVDVNYYAKLGTYKDKE